MYELEEFTDHVRFQSQNQVQSTYTLVDDATKLRHIHSTAYDRFMKTIEVV